MLCCDGVRLCFIVGGAGWAALMLISRNPGGVTLERRRCSCLLVVDCGEHGGQTPLLAFWAKLCSTDIIMSARWVASFSKIFVSGLERLCVRR